MTTEMLLLLVLAAMTVVAFMIAINSRGRWRVTLSCLLALGMLAGTIWVFTLQYSVSFNIDSQRERHRSLREEVERGQLQAEPSGPMAVCSALIMQANEFAKELLNEKLHDPSLSHSQMIAHANSAERRLEELQNEMSAKKQDLESYPEAAALLNRAMTELRAASHLYNRYYFAENSAAEAQTERLFRQKVQNAKEVLLKAEKTLLIKQSN